MFLVSFCHFVHFWCSRRTVLLARRVVHLITLWQPGPRQSWRDYGLQCTHVTENMDPPQTKQKPLKRRYAGAATYSCKFSPEWKQTYPFIAEVEGDEHSFLCTVCNRTVKCSHQGIADVQRHASKDLHKRNTSALKSQSTLQFLPKTHPILIRLSPI